MPLSREQILALDVKVTGAAEARRELDKTGKAAAGANRKTKGSFDNATKSVKGFNAALFLGGATSLAVGGVAAIRRFADQAERITGIARGFELLAGRVGQSADVMLGKMSRASDGLITDLELMKQANNAIILGLPVTTDSMEKMVEISVNLGRALGIDATHALESFITGVGRNSREMLDNLGIIIDLDTAYREYARTLGVAVDDLSDAAKTQALYNAALSAGADISEILSNDVETVSIRIKRLATEVSNVVDTYVNLINQIGAGNIEILRMKAVVLGGRIAWEDYGRAVAGKLLRDETLRRFVALTEINKRWKETEEKKAEAAEKTKKAYEEIAELQLPGLFDAARPRPEPIGPGQDLIGDQDPITGLIDYRTAANEAAIANLELGGSFIDLQEGMVTFHEAVAQGIDAYGLMERSLGTLSDALWGLANDQEMSVKSVLNAIARQVFGTLSAIAIESVIRGMKQNAMAAAAWASFNPIKAGMHKLAAKKFFSTAAKAGAGAGLALGVGLATSGGGGGGGGASAAGRDRPEFAVGPTPGSPGQGPLEIRVFFEGQGFFAGSEEELAQKIGEQYARQAGRAGLLPPGAFQNG